MERAEGRKTGSHQTRTDEQYVFSAFSSQAMIMSVAIEKGEHPAQGTGFPIHAVG